MKNMLKYIKVLDFCHLIEKHSSQIIFSLNLLMTKEQIDSLFDEFCKTIINVIEDLIPHYDWSAKRRRECASTNPIGTTN